MRDAHLIEYEDGSMYYLYYNPEKHSYESSEDGKEWEKVPSVTRIIDSCFPKYLTDWAVQEGADFFLKSIEPYRLAPTEAVGTFCIL